MEKFHFKRDVIIFVAAIIGLIVFILLYQHIFPYAGLKLFLSKKQIENVALSKLNDFGYDVSQYKERFKFRQDGEQIKYLTRQYSFDEAIDIMKHEIPAFYWDIRWQVPKDLLKSLTKLENDEVTVNSNPEEIANAKSDYNFKISTKGEICEFNAEIDEKVNKDTLDAERLNQRAMVFLSDLLNEKVELYEFDSTDIDTISTFKWKRTEAFHGQQVELEIKLHGNKIVHYHKKYIPPKLKASTFDDDIYATIPIIISFLIYFVVIIVIIVQKLRRDEISIKIGMTIGLIVVLAFIIIFLFSSIQDSFFEILITLLLIPTFLFLAILAVIGAGESVCREIMPEKLITFDALLKFKIKFHEFSLSLYRGTALAFISLGFVALYIKLSSSISNSYFSIKESDITNFVLVLPFVYVLSSAFMSTIFSEFIFRLFTISFLRKRINNLFLIIFISGFFWAFNFIGDGKYALNPVYLQILKNLILGIIFAYFFLKFDLVTVIVGSLLFNMILTLYPTTFFGSTFLLFNSVALWLFVGLLIVIGFTGLNKKLNLKELTEYEPPYVKRMQERERIQRELEIARKVQLSFLPKKMPEIPGIDLATVCIPATEVGGDYFDFINLGEGKLGIVIGDVSGKGLSAAFHMTLTKGFVKSQTREALSPKEVMINLNELFFENVERGTFISMIYGIFDIPNKTFTFARAGHNPIIIRSNNSNSVELLCPKGIALGLEKGDIFKKVIQEQQITISKNDVFILYTDGVSEAMNADRDEFGEERLESIINDSSHMFASEILKVIRTKVENFVGNTPQHDDLTMIIVKIR